MKIAVLLFGHLRTFEYCAPYLKKNLLDKYDCDVFIHTWDETDSRTKSWRNKETVPCVLDKNIKQKLVDIYEPKGIQIETQPLRQEVLIHSLIDDKSTSLNGCHFMFDSMSKANALRKKYERKHSCSYDIVLVTRPDVALYADPQLEKTLDEARILNLDIDKCRFFSGLYGDSKTNCRLILSRVSDIFFFAKGGTIDRYIGSNLNISEKYASNHFLNICSIYASNEIASGIMPVEICFALEKDWKNVVVIPQKMSVERRKSKLYKLMHFYWLRKK